MFRYGTPISGASELIDMEAVRRLADEFLALQLDEEEAVVEAKFMSCLQKARMQYL